MGDEMLSDCRVLIVEDQFLLASDLARRLTRAGAQIVGPVATLAEAEEQVGRGEFDVAMLDIRLDDELVYPAADMMRRRGLPFAFFTGFDEIAVPERFSDIFLCQKPCADEVLVDIVRRLRRKAPRP